LYGLWGRKLAEGFLEMSIELMGLFLWRVKIFFFLLELRAHSIMNGYDGIWWLGGN
jgi:hypothetical protein